MVVYECVRVCVCVRARVKTRMSMRAYAGASALVIADFHTFDSVEFCHYWQYSYETLMVAYEIVSHYT